MLLSLVLPITVANAALAAYTFDPLQHLAGIAPYFEPSDPPLDPAPPQGCNVTRAAYLVRHAAIWANDFDYEEFIDPFVSKLQNTTVDWKKAGPLAFLSTWNTPIEDDDIEELTQVGRQEAFTLGVSVGQRYPSFKAPGKVWTSTAERTEKSAQSFIEGLVTHSNETELVSVSEGEEEGADSLTPYEGCPAYSSSAGSEQSGQYQKLYTKPIIERFHALAPSFNFTPNDIFGMQELCGYETVIRGSSPFCSLDVFSPNDWLGFEYTNDIQYHYNTGYGNDVAGAIGFPWLNATAGVLTANDTDSSDAQDIYISFTHRELPPVVLVALGLFNNSAFSGGDDINATMPLDAQNYRRAWKSSHIIPFLTNIAIEKLSCDSYGFGVGEHYRVLVNQSPQPLPGCTDGPGESCSRDGFQKFVQSRGEILGSFGEKCGVDYSNSTDILSIYGVS
ncbi:phosphoglycerate mutase-like protein [Lophium mytilinum]|uniref:Phosphoglycerate mutase-like protein n=1 Tax=Lophium mytilinum TaxID=390894 RepID=A0A6A6RJ29_9PEZI|nr:phosphoglycerate mutase-like protein [Lophium mytilinum]